MATTDTNQSNIERAETIADWTQKTVNLVSKYYGGPVGQAFSNFLTGQAGLTTSMGDLIDKINKGTATGDDVADALQDMASIVAGFGVMAGYANPWMFGVLFGVGLLRGAVDYLEEHPELGNELLDVLKQPINMNEIIDIWDFFNNEYQISFTVNDLWNAAQNWAFPREPLVLDLDGDGIETLGINATTHVIFDHDGDGLKTGTGWISADDGLLVFDRNANGTIDNGSELFGDQTLVNGVKATDGFSALAGEDTNADGKFDATDTNFANVRVWQDTNADGISQSSELHTLTELNISSINLTSTTSNTVSNGNVQIAKGTYTKTNGTTGDSGTLGLLDEMGVAGNLNFAQMAVNNQNFRNTRRVA